ncbi:hypothetical protein PN456_02495 [Nodularia spumigena CS-586/05]|uniref:hypothetical protein n=1 Tax=Nodularia spumigena TaxID=70799 RepID=UPI00232E0059|nr:hypothetical protein [Nodularia spumigena]MDB9342067.1 hypothetical protein [Nodularia spumigena CS-588/06]MDB9367831.1 hypothetical protein [Nodularia spumigena CS-586/05]
MLLIIFPLRIWWGASPGVRSSFPLRIWWWAFRDRLRRAVTPSLLIIFPLRIWWGASPGVRS